MSYFGSVPGIVLCAEYLHPLWVQAHLPLMEVIKKTLELSSLPGHIVIPEQATILVRMVVVDMVGEGRR